MKLGDHIKVLEKDFVIEGKIDDVTFFFVHIISDDGDRITIPNSIILQKNISVSHPDKIKAGKRKLKSPKTPDQQPL